MSLFPVSYSLLSKQALGLHIQHHYEIGSVVKIQYFLRGMNDTYEVETDVDKYIFRIYRADRRSRSDIEFELKLAAELKNRISELEIKGLDWGVCHGDLHGNTNAAFAKDGKLTHYDFDLCGYGWTAYDIAEFRLAREIHSGHDPKEVEGLWDAFLKGYGSVRSLSENDFAVVPVFVAIRQLWLFGLCFQDSEFAGIADFDEGFIDSKMQCFKSLGYV